MVFLLQRLFQRINAYLSETLILTITGAIALVDQERRLKHAEPLRLRLLRLIVDGLLKVSVPLPSNILSRIKELTGKIDADEALQQLLPRQFASTIHGLLIDLYRESERTNGIADLYCIVETRLPRDVITDLAIELFLGDCVPIAEALKRPQD
jgi:hypothetical protein